jgi:hypothetical protein
LETGKAGHYYVEALVSECSCMRYAEGRPFCEALEQSVLKSRQAGRSTSRILGARTNSHGIPLHSRCCSQRLPLSPASYHHRHAFGENHGDVHSCTVTGHYRIASQKQGYQAHVQYTKFRRKPSFRLHTNINTNIINVVP